MTRFQNILAALFAFVALPALAHDGVHINDAYARSNGVMGGSGAIFFVVENHQIEDDRLIAAASDVANMVQLHTHIAGADGVMQMREVPDGFMIPANGLHALARGGDHVMLMGLTTALKDGDIVKLMLTFEKAGVVEVEVPVDNARKADAAMDHGMHKGHDMSDKEETKGMTNP